MKKFLFPWLLAIVIGIASRPAYADIPDEYIGIGGIALGCGPDFVQEVFGPPAHRERLNSHGLIPADIVEEFRYGTNFLVTFADGQAVAISSFGNNGLATPLGVTVGMDVYVLNYTYSKADAVAGDNITTTTYLYHGTTPNTYLKFIVKGLTIVSITCGTNFHNPVAAPEDEPPADTEGYYNGQ